MTSSSRLWDLQSADTEIKRTSAALRVTSPACNLMPQDRDMLSSVALDASPVRTPLGIITVCSNIPQPISTPTNHTIYDLILCGSVAGPFLLITALLPHMLVVALMAFAEIWAHIVVKTLRANLRRQSISGAGNSFGSRGSITCSLQLGRHNISRNNLASWSLTRGTLGKSGRIVRRTLLTSWALSATPARSVVPRSLESLDESVV